MKLLPILCAALVVAGCRRKVEQPPPPPRAPILDPTPTPIADKAIAQGVAEDKEDPSWLGGMWQEGDRDHWYLFNLPNEVAELQGKPASVVRRGKLSVHGRYVSVIYPNDEVHFTATKDHAELSSDSPRAVYRRGSAP